MKYYIIAGEASGDLHASNLVASLKKIDGNAVFRGWGGDLMELKGVNIIKHYKDLAFMGFWEVLKNLKTIMKNLSFCKQDILSFQPDVLILVDYPGFNLRIAEWAKKNNIKVVYYISPQVWAWKENRVKKIKKYVDKMLVILPFEKTFYEKHHFEVAYVGHPLLDAISNFNPETKETFYKKNELNDKPIIALLPGSRKQEIEKMLPLMLSVTDSFNDYQFVVSKAPSVDEHFYKKLIKNKAILCKSSSYDLLSYAKAALVTSGTATLETALFKVPQIVCYKGNNISYQIAKRVINVKYISLVNLIYDDEVVKELIQYDLTTQNLKLELQKILTPDNRKAILEKYETLIQKLGEGGASDKAAEQIWHFLNS